MNQYVVFCSPKDNSAAATLVPVAALKYENGQMFAYGSDQFVNRWEALLSTDKEVANFHTTQPLSFVRAFGGTYSPNLVFVEGEDLKVFNDKIQELGYEPKAIFGTDNSTETTPQWDGTSAVTNVRIV